MRQLLDRFATYAGSDPFRASATLGVIADVELSGGVWYPRGGVRAIALALERLALELWGFELHTGTAVAALEPGERRPRVRGVRLSDGRLVQAKAVVANPDVRAVYEHLLPAGVVPRRRRARLARLEPSSSGLAFLLGVRGASPELAHHNVLFCGDYRAEFHDVFERGRLPQDPTVRRDHVEERSAARPAGLRELVRAGQRARAPRGRAGNGGGPGDDRALPGARARAPGRGRERLRGRIVTEQVLTPRDLERDTGAWRGVA